MNKRLFLTIFFGVFLLISGCNEKNVDDDLVEESSKRVTLSLWVPPFTSFEDSTEVDAWKRILEPFEKENDVRVELLFVSWEEYNESFFSAITSGDGPDVGYMYREMLGEYVEMGAIADLTRFISDSDRDNYLYEEHNVLDDKLFALPFVVGNSRVLVYNESILNQNGINEVPRTWDDFISVCLSIKRDTDNDGIDDVYPFLQEWNEPQHGGLNAVFFPYFWQAGGELFDDDNKLSINSKAGRDAIGFIHDMRFKYHILSEDTLTMEGADIYEQFILGNVAFIVTGSGDSTPFNEAGFDWGYITALEKEKQATFSAVDSLVILESSERKDLAYKLISHILSSQSMETYHKEVIPFIPISQDGIYLADEEFSRIYEEDREVLKALPIMPNSDLIYEYLYRNLQLMIRGDLEPEEVIENVTSYSEYIN